MVGPRPITPNELAYYQDWHYRRFDVAAGMTGLSLVNDHKNQSFDEMMQLDWEYVISRSLRKDVMLMIRTFFFLFDFKTQWERKED